MHRSSLPLCPSGMPLQTISHFSPRAQDHRLQWFPWRIVSRAIRATAVKESWYWPFSCISWGHSDCQLFQTSTGSPNPSLAILALELHQPPGQSKGPRKQETLWWSFLRDLAQEGLKGEVWTASVLIVCISFESLYKWDYALSLYHSHTKQPLGIGI